MTKKKRLLLILLALVLVGLAVYLHTLTAVSTLLLVAALGVMLSHRQEAAERKRIPPLAWVLGILSLLSYLAGWFLLGE